MEAQSTEWVKDCDCRTTSTAGAVRSELAFNEDYMQRRMKFTFYPQPSCDQCGKPWLESNEN